MTLFGLIYLGVLWISYRLIRATIDRLGDRISTWLFPDAHPITYRLALCLARLAALITPKRQLGWLVGFGFQHNAWIDNSTDYFFRDDPPHMLNCVSTVPGFYAHPLLARNAAPARGSLEANRALEGLADIEWIIKTDFTISGPIRLVLPLLKEAIEMRLRNLIVRMNWVAVACYRVPMAMARLLIRTIVLAVVTIDCISVLLAMWTACRRASVDNSWALTLIKTYLKRPYQWVRHRDNQLLELLFEIATDTYNSSINIRVVDFDVALSESKSQNPYRAILIEAAQAVRQGDHDLAASLRDELSELAKEEVPYSLDDGGMKLPALPYFFTGYSGARID